MIVTSMIKLHCNCYSHHLTRTHARTRAHARHIWSLLERGSIVSLRFHDTSNPSTSNPYKCRAFMTAYPNSAKYPNSANNPSTFQWRSQILVRNISGPARCLSNAIQPPLPVSMQLAKFWFFRTQREKGIPRFNQHATHAHIGNTVLSPLLSTLHEEVFHCHTCTWEEELLLLFALCSTLRSGLYGRHWHWKVQFWWANAFSAGTETKTETGAWEAISISQIHFKHHTLNYRTTIISMRGHSHNCTVRKFQQKLFSTLPYHTVCFSNAL